MNFSRHSYEQAAQAFFQQNLKLAERYLSPTLLQTVVDGMLQSLPAVTAAKIAFDRLVANGTLARTDGRDERHDAQQAATEAQANRDKIAARIDAPPLTNDESQYFASLSQGELAQKYWADGGANEFAIRYRKAAREQGFQIPAKPVAAPSTDISDEKIREAAALYRSLPARELQTKLRDPRFKLLTMMAIKQRLV